MRVCGIIAEYDPFHKGHLFQLQEARRKSSADYIICVISTAFTQRGIPGLFSTKARAKMALLAGADLVLGMPVSYSCAQANRFAMGGVGILHSLGVVNFLSFGVEETSLTHLYKARDLILNPSVSYSSSLKDGLSKGQTLAKAQGAALLLHQPDATASILNQPNFNLAISYLLALSSLNSQIEPIPVQRYGRYHDTKITAFASASAVRSAIFKGDWTSVQKTLPDSSYKLVKETVLNKQLHLPDALDKTLIAKLLDGKDYANIAEISEGLDLRMLRYAKDAVSRKQLIELIKTKRYTYARISRMLSQSLIGIQKQDLSPPAYAHLMGFRKSAAPLLQAIGKSGFPLISRPAKCEDPDIKLDMYAEQLWYIGSNQPASDAFKQKLFII